MGLKKIAPIAGVAVLSAGLLTACGGSSATPASLRREGRARPARSSARPTRATPAPVRRAERRRTRPSSPRSPTYNVAFSQNASNNPWRLAETASMQGRGDQARASSSPSPTPTTSRPSRSRHQGPDRPEAGRPVHRPDHRAARATSSRTPAGAGIPVFLLDRDVDHNVAKPGQDFVTVIQSDFVQEGKRAAVQMAKATGGNAKIIELEGTTGASPAIDRKKGFDEAIKQCPGMQVVVSQDARLHPRQGPVGRRDAAAVAPGRHRDLRAQRRDGARRDRRDQGDRQGCPARTSRSSRSTARRTASRPSRPASSTRRWSAARASAPSAFQTMMELRGRQADPDADHQHRPALHQGQRGRQRRQGLLSRRRTGPLGSAPATTAARARGDTSPGPDRREKGALGGRRSHAPAVDAGHQQAVPRRARADATRTSRWLAARCTR